MGCCREELHMLKIKARLSSGRWIRCSLKHQDQGGKVRNAAPSALVPQTVYEVMIFHHPVCFWSLGMKSKTFSLDFTVSIRRWCFTPSYQWGLDHSCRSFYIYVKTLLSHVSHTFTQRSRRTCSFQINLKTSVTNEIFYAGNFPATSWISQCLGDSDPKFAAPH